jgi:hypothetical protein
MGDAIQQGSSRILSAQNLSLGSSSGTSTSVFGSSTMQVRVVANQPATFLVGDTPSVSSTAINASGSYLPANMPEYISVVAGQRLSAVTTSTSAIMTVSECGA